MPCGMLCAIRSRARRDRRDFLLKWGASCARKRERACYSGASTNPFFFSIGITDGARPRNAR